MYVDYTNVGSQRKVKLVTGDFKGVRLFINAHKQYVSHAHASHFVGWMQNKSVF